VLSIGIVGQAAAKKERSSEVVAVQRLWAAGIPMTCAVFHCYRSVPRLVTGHWPLWCA